MSTAIVRLHWKVNTPKGVSPRGNRFCAPARFADQGDDWINNAWSLMVTFEEPPDSQGDQLGKAHFLVADAPHDWLSIGKRFTLFEGRLAIADGVVLEAACD